MGLPSPRLILIIVFTTNAHNPAQSQALFCEDATNSVLSDFLEYRYAHITRVMQNAAIGTLPELQHMSDMVQTEMVLRRMIRNITFVNSELDVILSLINSTETRKMKPVAVLIYYKNGTMRFNEQPFQSAAQEHTSGIINNKTTLDSVNTTSDSDSVDLVLATSSSLDSSLLPETKMPIDTKIGLVQRINENDNNQSGSNSSEHSNALINRTHSGVSSSIREEATSHSGYPVGAITEPNLVAVTEDWLGDDCKLSQTCNWTGHDQDYMNLTTGVVELDAFTTAPSTWHIFCSHADGFLAHTASFVLDKVYRHEIRLHIRVTLDLSDVKVNQCAIPESEPIEGLRSLRHKCAPLSQCVYNPSSQAGLRLGDYLCVCSSSSVTSSVNSSIPGVKAEVEYYRLLHGHTSEYNDTFGACQPCTLGCPGVPCEESGQCGMTLLPDMAVRLPLVIITAFTMVAMVILMGMTCKLKKHKVIRAASPGFLCLSLFGAIVMYSEILVAALALTDMTCMIRPWIRHFGFTLTYGGILLKMWRISVIMRVFKARMFRTKDSHLYKKLLGLLSMWFVYLLTWSAADPMMTTAPGESSVIICRIQAWEFIAVFGECLMLCWGAYLCVESRKAPALYNETVPISYALLNESCWQIFMVISRLLLYHYPDPGILLMIQFLRTQITVTAAIALLYSPKLRLIFSKSREVQGTLTDVYGHRRVHRLSLMINKHGDIRTIYCVPCGPLVYADQTEQLTMISQDRHNLREDEYTKAEVDALIELVSKLKDEKEQHKMQVKRLLHIMRVKKTANGLSPSLVAEESCYEEIESPHKGTPVIVNPPIISDGGQSYENDENRNLDTGYRKESPNACTTTYVSSCNDISLNNQQNEDIRETALDAILSSCPGCALAAAPCQACVSPPNGISQYALNVLRRQLARNHVLGREMSVVRDRDTSPETEDFPKLLQTHDAHVNNNYRQMPLPLLPTVYGDVVDANNRAALGIDNRVEDCNANEVRDTGSNGPLPTKSSSPDTAQSPMIPDASNEKMNFIIYI